LKECQGCPLSPLLFSIDAEMMMNEAMENSEAGVKVGELIRGVRFADYQGMMDSTEEGLQRVMDRLRKTCKDYNMKINVQNVAKRLCINLYYLFRLLAG